MWCALAGTGCPAGDRPAEASANTARPEDSPEKAEASSEKLYDRSELSASELARSAQLEELYGFRFPTELFTFWRWHEGLSEAQRRAFGEVMGMRLVGPFDVLGGKFDDVDLAYPTSLHWRFQHDPPEFVTIISGDSDGLHWGLWFDDHAELAPVVASYYARDAFELQISADTVFGTVHAQVAAVRASIKENITGDPKHKSEYLDDLKVLADLEASLPTPQAQAPRPRVIPTPEGMGIVAPTHGGDAAREQLVRGKAMWIDDPRKAGPILRDAYTLAERPVLAAIAEAHTIANPTLPGVDILEYPRGSYHSLEAALATPSEVKLLGITDAGLKNLPDLSSLINLEELTLYGNELTDLPTTLKACQKLKRVNLHRNRIKSVPEVLFELPALQWVSLGGDVPKAELEHLKKRLPDADIR